ASYFKPSIKDIFSCSTGLFVTNTNTTRGLTPRFTATFNRLKLLSSSFKPVAQVNVYKYPITNYYSRIVHIINLNKRGYAFLYDDVILNGGLN
ncbi:glycoside hydrolase family 64 protein, partial [Cadophora sp. DSE1049]